jgi:hypothetical protein
LHIAAADHIFEDGIEVDMSDDEDEGRASSAAVSVQGGHVDRETFLSSCNQNPLVG